MHEALVETLRDSLKYELWTQHTTLQSAAAQRADRRNADYPIFASLFKCSKHLVGCYASKRNESENVGSYDFLFQFPV